MAEITKETISTTETAPSQPEAVSSVKDPASNSQTIEYIIYFFLGLLEILLAFRLVLKMMGASSASAFVRIIYDITNIFIMPFEGIFRQGITEGIETTAVFEPSTLFALIVYALLAWGIVKLVRISSGERQPE